MLVALGLNIHRFIYNCCNTPDFSFGITTDDFTLIGLILSEEKFRLRAIVVTVLDYIDKVYRRVSHHELNH